jgi:predicted MFS family arabinose efflux permease
MSTSATPTPFIATPVPPGRSPALDRLAVLSVTLGIFSLVTAEILPIGLLTSIGADFGVSDGTAGLMMFLPGIVAAVSAPVVTTVTARVDRRRMLCAFMALLALANVLAAAAPHYGLVLLSRVLVGVTIGGFWSIAAGLAARLVPPASVGRATAVIFSAVPLGSVLGVPLGTFAGDLAGWRTAFAGMGVLTLGVLALLVLTVPGLPPVHVTRPAVLRGLVRGTTTRFALLATFLIVLAHFGAYTYVTPFLEQVTGVSAGAVTVFLFGYGAAGILGNFAAGGLVARYPHGTFAAAAGLIAAATLLLPVLGRWETGAIVLLLVWGAGYGAVPVASQTWFARAAPDRPEAASVLFTASFQATIALGALGGGVVVDRAAPSAVMVLGGLTASLMLPAVWAHHRTSPAPASPPGGQRSRS